MGGPEVDWSFFSLIDYLNKADDEARPPDPAAWRTLLDRLAEAVELVGSSSLIDGAADQAGAFRGLLQLLHFGLDRGLGSADPARPVFSRPWQPHLFDFGAANPDAVYHTVALRDDLTYCVSGNRGNADFLSFELFAGKQQAGSISTADLAADADGEFQILFGPQHRDGNWLEVVPGTSSMLTREFFGDWARARPGTYRIECLDPAPVAWPSMSGDRVERELTSLGDWVLATLRIFIGAQEKALANNPNAFRPQPSRPPSSELPSIHEGVWDLAPDECLVIEAGPPPSSYWGIQLGNVLWNTLDFANRQTSLNLGQLDREPDGSIRLVLAHEDPGVANWLDTLGQRRGVILLRFTYPAVEMVGRPERTLASNRSDWMNRWTEEPAASAAPSAYPAPSTRVMRLAELDPDALGGRRVSRDERRRAIDERLRQVTRLQAG